MLSIATNSANPAAASASRSKLICQTPNRVHLILTPEDGEGLALALSRAHRLYAGFVNARARQTGHLFQGRFGSVALEEEHLMNAARYVAFNPVRARLVQRAEDWPHSSVRAHLAGRDDGLVRVKPLLDRAPRFADLIEGEADAAAFVRLRRSELIGWPLGSARFVAEIEERVGRVLAPGKRGRKPRKESATGENIKRKKVASCLDGAPWSRARIGFANVSGAVMSSAC